MRGRGSAGCMGFSVIGVLVSVFLVVWLGSKVMDGTNLTTQRPTDDDRPTSTAPSVSTIPAGITISASPSTGLGDGSEVRVTSDGFPAGASVEITTCVSRTNIVTKGQEPCDPARAATATVGADGTLSELYTVGRVVTVGGLPYDCGTEAGYCSVQVRSVAHPDQSGSAPLAFAGAGPGEPEERPEITLPD